MDHHTMEYSLGDLGAFDVHESPPAGRAVGRPVPLTLLLPWLSFMMICACAGLPLGPGAGYIMIAGCWTAKAVTATMLMLLHPHIGAFLIGSKPSSAYPGAILTRRSSSNTAGPLLMAREWISDAFNEISDLEIDRIHKYIDTKGKNVIKGPTTVAGPDGSLINVNVGETVEIIDGVVFRTFLSAVPPINEAKLKAENKVMLEVVWKENWQTEGFTVEVFGATGPECLEYTRRFCEATGTRIAGDVQCKAAYYEVPLEVVNDSLVMKLQSLQAGTGTLEL